MMQNKLKLLVHVISTGEIAQTTVVTQTITDGRTDGQSDDGRWVVRDLDAL
jgi:hypothetical protein